MTGAGDPRTARTGSRRGATARIGDQLVDADGIDRWELDRARHALGYLKRLLGNDAVRDLLAADTAEMDRRVRGWRDASGGRWRWASVELDVTGPGAERFHDWYRTAFADVREPDLLAGHPEHFVNHPAGETVEVLENVGETQLPWRVHYRNLPDDAPFPAGWPGGHPVRFGAELLDSAGARIGFTQRELRDTPDGSSFRITSTLPAAAPDGLVERHLRHMAIEFSNWARMAREQDGAG